jgi:hypothetical protein
VPGALSGTTSGRGLSVVSSAGNASPVVFVAPVTAADTLSVASFAAVAAELNQSIGFQLPPLIFLLLLAIYFSYRI